jgi:hypothetical protein
MPRKSAKDEHVDELEVILRERKEASDTRFLMDMPCEVEDDMDVVYHEEYCMRKSRALDILTEKNTVDANRGGRRCCTKKVFLLKANS